MRLAKLFYIILFGSTTLSLADTRPVSPWVAKYQHHQNRIDPKTNHPYQNAKDDIGTKKDEVYYYDKTQSYNVSAQTNNPYFIMTDSVRNSRTNIDRDQMTERVITTINNQNNPENLPPKSKQQINDRQDNQTQTVSRNSSNNTSITEKAKNKALDFMSAITSRLSDEEVAKRPNGMYTGFMASLMMYGHNKISGSEERANTSANTIWTRYDTFSTTKGYLPSVELGLFVGWQINNYFRAHLDLAWTYLYGNIGNVSSYGGANFTLPSDFANGNLVASTFNIFWDFYPNLVLWPSLGVGIGAAFMAFDKYSNMSLLYPVLNFYAGVNYMLSDNKTIISVGYKLQYIYTGLSDNQSQVHDASVPGLLDTRPTRQDESVFSAFFMHKLEVAVRFY